LAAAAACDACRRTGRLALKLLGEILLDRNFQQVMQKYIKCDKQLVCCMDLLVSNHSKSGESGVRMS
jgi:hypothetical protein